MCCILLGFAVDNPLCVKIWLNYNLSMQRKETIIKLKNQNKPFGEMAKTSGVAKLAIW